MRIPSVILLGLAACAAPREERRPLPPGPVGEVPPDAPRPPEAPRAPEAPEPPPAPPPVAPPAWVENSSLESNAGTYVLHVSPAPAELPDNEPFRLEVWIADAARPHEIARDVELSLAAAMPEHGHGMNRVPKATKRDDGSFLVEGMLFHMTGRWELYLDVTRGAVTERAQCDVVLE